MVWFPDKNTRQAMQLPGKRWANLCSRLKNNSSFVRSQWIRNQVFSRDKGWGLLNLKATILCWKASLATCNLSNFSTDQTREMIFETGETSEENFLCCRVVRAISILNVWYVCFRCIRDRIPMPNRSLKRGFTKFKSHSFVLGYCEKCVPGGCPEALKTSCFGSKCQHAKWLVIHRSASNSRWSAILWYSWPKLALLTWKTIDISNQLWESKSRSLILTWGIDFNTIHPFRLVDLTL